MRPPPIPYYRGKWEWKRGIQQRERVDPSQMVGWIRVCRGHSVLGLNTCKETSKIPFAIGDPAPPPQKGHNPQFLVHVGCGQTAGWIKMPLDTEVNLGPGNIVLGTQLPSPKAAQPPIFGPCLLWPNGWMDYGDYAATWHGSRPQTGQHRVGWVPRFAQKGAKCPIFGPCLLWPNGWMYQDASWYAGRPQPSPHCVRWGTSSPKRGIAPQFLAHVCCGQTAEWIKTPLGMEVGLNPAHIVLGGEPAPPKGA